MYNNVYGFTVFIDMYSGYDRDVSFRTYRQAKAFYDSIADVPYKSITADTDEGTKILERGGDEI